ncbi:MAG: HD domain-containing phosphohydrolase, partial [Alphaproteobacteria bacterium]
MAEAAEAGAAPRHSRAWWSVAAAAVALAVVAAVGVVLVFVFLADERERDLRGWQARMGIVADSRFAAVNDWIDRQFAQVRDLAENAPLQLYLTRLTVAGGDASRLADEPAERTYLRNLLVAAADAGGFTAPLRGPEIDANVERVGVAGMALIDNSGEVVVATPAMPPLERAFRDVIFANRGKRVVFDMHLGVGGAATMGFAAPVFAIQSDSRPSDQIGAAVGIKEVGEELFPLLAQPGATEATAEVVLVRGAGEAIEYLSPVADGTRPLRRTLARTTPDLAAAYALASPGGFAVRRDYRNAEVLVVGRRFTTVPWTLMYKIDTGEALAETNSRLTRLLGVFLLIIAAVAAALIAAWRHGTSRRASETARRARQLARRYAEQHGFLRLVTDSQPNAMAIIGDDGRYLWANRRLWEDAGLSRDEVIGKGLSAVIGPVPAKEILHSVREVLESGVSGVKTHSEERDGKLRTYQSQYIPLAATAEMPPRVLIASEDVTPAVEERAKRERIMGQLVTTLVNVVDRRDPYSANHSAWVAKVARAIAEEMELDEEHVECVEVAGRLMNLGKILVPEELLSKTTPLTDDEIELIRNSIDTSADLLEGVEFTGPVVETLRQLHEHAEGDETTPGGDDVLI